MKMPTKYRVKPSIWMGYLFAAALFVLPGMIGSLFHTELPVTWFVNASLALAITLVFAGILGWIRPFFFEPARARGVLPTVLAFGPFLYIIYCGLSTNWAEIPGWVVLFAFANGIFSGIWEEFIFRGALLVGARGKVREVWVAVITAVTFGLLHGLNFFTEPGAETAYQLVYALMIGFGLYALRRVTGSIFAGMLLHMLNNALETTAERTNAPIAQLSEGFGLVNIIFIGGLVLGIIAAVLVIRQTPKVSLFPATFEPKSAVGHTASA